MSWRRRARPLIDRAAALTGALAMCERRMRGGLTILMYHRVLPAEQAAAYPLRSLAMPEEAFRGQVAWLADRCETLPLCQALKAMEAELARDRPLVAITFDDGYADNHEVAAPILEERGLRATFFLTTDLVGGAGPLWFDRAATLWEHAPDAARTFASRVGQSSAETTVADLRSWLAFLKACDPATRAQGLADIERERGRGEGADRFRGMTPGAAAELHARGHEIGAHTLTHPLLPQLADAALQREMVAAKAEIEGWIGAPVAGLAYPNGDHDARTVEAARAAGYGHACTTAPGVNLPGADPFLLRRLDMTPDRVATGTGAHDALGFRAEVASLRRALR